MAILLPENPVFFSHVTELLQLSPILRIYLGTAGFLGFPLQLHGEAPLGIGSFINTKTLCIGFRTKNIQLRAWKVEAQEQAQHVLANHGGKLTNPICLHTCHLPYPSTP